jgi:hypothetical protein
MGVGDQHHATLTSGQGRTHATYCTGGWVGPSDGKSRPPAGISSLDCPASHCTDCTIPAHPLFNTFYTLPESIHVNGK